MIFVIIEIMIQVLILKKKKNKYNEKFGFGSINNPNVTGFTLNHIPDIIELKHPVFNHNQVNKLTGILIGELVSKYDKLFEKSNYIKI